MKRSYKKFAKFVSLFLVIALAFSLVSCAGDVQDKKTVAVIAKGESHAFWQEVKKGAQAAAEKYGYEIDFIAPASESKAFLDVQSKGIAKAVENKYSAVVLAAVNDGVWEELEKAYDNNIPVIEFDSGIFPKDIEKITADGKNPIKSKVATSNIMASEIAAENLFNAIKGEVSKKDKYVVGIIQHDETPTGINRAGGFYSKLETLADADPATKGKVKIEKVVALGESKKGEYKEALEELYKKGADAIFMTNEGVVKEVYNAVAADEKKYENIKFCGFDSGSAQMEWMRKPVGAKLVGAVAQNSYQIGYKAVEQAVFAAEGKEVTPNVMLSGTWWNVDSVDTMLADGLVYEG